MLIPSGEVPTCPRFCVFERFLSAAKLGGLGTRAPGGESGLQDVLTLSLQREPPIEGIYSSFHVFDFAFLCDVRLTKLTTSEQ
jgi:hypothetical protein